MLHGESLHVFCSDGAGRIIHCFSNVSISATSGRPFPLKGRYMANLFVHFEPTGHSLRHNAKMAAEAAKQDIHEKYQDSLNRGVSGHENDQSGLPSYIVEGTPEESHWRQQHPDGQVRGMHHVAYNRTCCFRTTFLIETVSVNSHYSEVEAGVV